MSYHYPDRYDLCASAMDLAEMTRHPQGDYVTYSDYERLLEAYEERGRLLRDIAAITENA